jgi:hypothetical protein
VRYLGSYPKADAIPTRLRSGTNADSYANAQQWVRSVQSGESV